DKMSLFQLLQRPHMSLREIDALAGQTGLAWNPFEQGAPGSVEVQAREQIEIQAVYHGYLKRQEEEVAAAVRLEDVVIPDGFDYAKTKGLSYESVEKLTRVRPTTVGQASRVPGVRPADIALLIGWLRKGVRPVVSSP
ncbi:MAG: hypothetical protein ABUL72_05420, partial [Armatimonadota bacterium]